MKRTCSLCWVGLLFTFTFQLVSVSQKAWAQSPHAKFQVLYTFKGQRDGGNPAAGVIQDPDGNLFGITYDGGELSCTNGIFAGCGVVFKVDRTGHETVLYRFTGDPADGRNPCAGVIRDDSGNLYGTTCYGGANLYYGTVFKLDLSGHETVLHSFTGGADGGVPKASLARDAAGNLFGTTYYGGSGACNDGIGVGCGVVFKLDPSGKQTVLHNFTGGKEGAYPQGGGLLLDATGNLYGTTSSGGDFGDGVVFELDSSGKETVLHQFAFPNNRRDGASPYGAFIRDAVGNLYGTTSYGGTTKYFGGTLFKVDHTGKERVLHSFGENGDGFSPDGLVKDTAGNFYGITLGNVEFNCSPQPGCGTVFKLDAAGKLTVLYTFTGVPDGAYPQVGLTRDNAGVLYGVTGFSGNQGCLGQGCGTVFKVMP